MARVKYSRLRHTVCEPVNVAERLERPHIIRVFRSETFQDGLRLIRLFERIEIEGFANIHRTLQRRTLRILP